MHDLKKKKKKKPSELSVICWKSLH